MSQKSQKIVVKQNQQPLQLLAQKIRKKLFGKCHPRLLDSIELILDNIRENDIKFPEFSLLHYQNYPGYDEDALNIISDEYGIDELSAFFFCLMLTHYDEESFTESDLTEDLRENKLGLLKYRKYINELKKRRLIQCKKKEKTCGYIYRITPDAVDALRNKKKFIPYNPKNRSLEEFFNEVKKIFDDRDDGWLSYKQFLSDLNVLLEKSKHLRFYNEIKKLELWNTDFIIIMFFCYRYSVFHNNSVYLSMIRRYIGNLPQFFNIEKEIDSGNHIFNRLNFLENDYSGDIMNFDSDEPKYRLTNKAIDLFLSEISIPKEVISNINNTNNTCSLKDKLPVKKLFYNDAEEAQIHRLEFALEEKNMQEIKKRLREKKMPAGITCFFYGEPGTGKTETAIQLANKSGREIIKVDLSTINSKYVGDGERNAKKIFDNYRELANKSNLAPILLINEADGMFTRRINLEHDLTNSTIAQMQNTMQNIFLDELESFEGILIATSNLSVNLDKAFERRFIYKIEFKKPEVKVRRQIWQSLMPELKKDIISGLAQNFAFSGGEIFNIARKSSINYAIIGQIADYSSLEILCKEEQKGMYPEKKAIGFNI